MNYYPHHIGDFNSATRHLTRIERSVYRDLLDLYYDTERPIMRDMDKLCRLIIARSDEERTAVEQVLNEFFTETDDGWFHARCEEEISRFQAGVQAKSAAGKASAAKRAQKTQQTNNTNPTAVEQPLNSRSSGDENPLTLCSTNQNQNQNHKKEEKISSGKPSLPAGFASFWLEWPGTPRKVAKAKCLERWQKASLEAIAGSIVAHVHREKTENRQWLDGYEPSPLTYLNQRRWEDGEGAQEGAASDWWVEAGFTSRFEAENFGCNRNTAHQFQDGKRLEAHA